MKLRKKARENIAGNGKNVSNQHFHKVKSQKNYTCPSNFVTLILIKLGQCICQNVSLKGGYLDVFTSYRIRKYMYR